MKILTTLILLLATQIVIAQKKWYHVSNNDIAVMSIEVVAGYSQGWRDEVQYHTKQLFRQFPNLNRSFWDIRVENPPGFLNTEWDADHVLKFTTMGSHVAAISVKSGDMKQYKGWDKVWKILFDIIKYYGAYKTGFFLAYNITHGNKL